MLVNRLCALRHLGPELALGELPVVEGLAVSAIAPSKAGYLLCSVGGGGQGVVTTEAAAGIRMVVGQGWAST